MSLKINLHPASLSFPIAAAAALIADDADARAAAPSDSYGYCPYGDAGYDPAPTGGYDYCGNQEILHDLSPRTDDAIPIDGVLVLQAVSTGPWNPVDAVTKVDAAVTQAGNPVPGTLEVTALHQTLLWRPAAPLTPGATYDFAATITNPAAPAMCVEPEIPVAFAFTASDQSVVALTPSTLTGTAELSESPIIRLDTLACCPDVSPSLLFSNCGGSTVDFDPAQCAPIVGYGVLSVDLTGTPSATGPTAAQVVYALEVDGNILFDGLPQPTFSTAIDKAFCAAVVSTDLGSGTSVTGALACFGDEHASKLGEHPIEPPDLGCSLRQCEPTDEAWDLASCTPLDPDSPLEPEGEKGCGCTSTATSDAALLLGLAGLVIARRRRR